MRLPKEGILRLSHRSGSEALSLPWEHSAHITRISPERLGVILRLGKMCTTWWTLYNPTHSMYAIRICQPHPTPIQPPQCRLPYENRVWFIRHSDPKGLAPGFHPEPCVPVPQFCSMPQAVHVFTGVAVAEPPVKRRRIVLFRKLFLE